MIAAHALVNNLDLLLMDSAGLAWHGNMGQGGDYLNNVEQVRIESPSIGRAGALVVLGARREL